MNNIIDFNLKKNLNIEYPISFPSYDSDYWIIRDNSNNILPLRINRISSKINFNRNEFFIKDFHFFCLKSKDIYSFRTLLDFRSYIKVFIDFINEKEPSITTFKQVDYNILLSYSNYLNDKKNNDTKFRSLKKVLLHLSAIDSRLVSDDINSHKIPKIKFLNEINNHSHYSEEDISNVSKIILFFIKSYFEGNYHIADKNIFIKFSYWFLALCTGFNKTGLNSLSIESFELIEENKKQRKYLIIGEKNRATKGYQHITLSVDNDKDNLFIKVIEELININDKNKDYLSENHKNTIFPLENQNHIKNSHRSYAFIPYNGNVNFLLEGTKTRDIIDNNGFKYVTFSTYKIRNNWSNKIFDLSKSEKIVSKMMNHKKVDTTIKHYLNTNISSKILYKFNLFQELLYMYSINENYENWSVFQKEFNIDKKNSNVICKEISEGVYESFLGNCFQKENDNCKTYFNCFNCENFSIIGEKDLWKIISFKELVFRKKKSSDFFKSHYQPLVSTIDSILSDFDVDVLIGAKKMFNNHGLHPFWKNDKIFDIISNDFERLENE